MATPAFRAAGTAVFTANNVASPTTLAPSAPAGRVAGDLLVLVTNSRSITATAATPTGWNLVSGFPKASATASGGKIYVFTRIADGTTADDASFQWSSLTTGTTGDSAGARILAYQNATETLDTTVPAATDAAATTSFNIPAITTTVNDSLVIGIGMRVNDTAHTFTVAASYTERYDGHTTTGTGHGTEVADQVKTTAGAVSATAITPSNTTSSRCLAVVVAFKATAATNANAGNASGSGTAQVASTTIRANAEGITDTGAAQAPNTDVKAKAGLASSVGRALPPYRTPGPVPIARVVANSGNTSSSTISFNLPSGLADGDYAYLSVVQNTNLDRGAPDASWIQKDFTSSGTAIQQRVYEKAVGASDSGTTVSWTLSNPQFWALACVIVRGGGGIEVTVAGTSQSANSTTWSTPDITPASGDNLTLLFHSWKRNIGSLPSTQEPPTPYYELIETSGNAATSIATAVNHAALVGGSGVAFGGNIGGGSYDTTTSDRVIFTVAIKSAASAATNANAGLASGTGTAHAPSTSIAAKAERADGQATGQNNDTAARGGAAVVASASNTSGTGATSSVSVVLPSGLQDGDKAYLLQTTNTGTDRGGPDSADAAWTLLDMSNSSTVLMAKIYSKPLTAAESGTTVSWTISNAQKWTVTLVVVRGDGGIDVQGTAWVSATGATTWQFNDVTTTTPDDLLLGFHTWRVNATGTTTQTPPTDWLEAVETSINAAASPTNGGAINHQQIVNRGSNTLGGATDGGYDQSATNHISLVLAIKPITGGGSTNASAGLASGTGTAHTPRADIATGTGAATGSGTASNPSDTVATTAQAATGTGAAQTPRSDVKANAQAATGTGTAYNSTISVGTNAPAGLASGTGTAYNPTVTASGNATPSTATGSGNAQTPRADVKANAGLASGVGAAQTPRSDIKAGAGAIIDTGTAYNPSATASGNATPSTATGSGTAQTPRADVKANAGLASGTGTAYNATGTTAVAGSAGLASGTGTAQTPRADVKANAGLASGAGTAYNATVSTSGNTNAQAGLASGVGAAQTPTVSVASNAEVPKNTVRMAFASTIEGLTDYSSPGALSWDGTEGHNGLGSVKVVTTAGQYGAWWGADYGVVGGASYTTRIWVKGTAGHIYRFYNQFWGTNGIIVGSPNSSFTATGNWEMWELTSVAPARAAFLRPIFRLDTPGITTFWLDDLEVSNLPAGTALDPNKTVRANAGLASGAGTAYNPSVTASGNANAGLASGVGTAYNPTGSSANATYANAGLASGTGTANTPRADIKANATAARAVATGAERIADGGFESGVTFYTNAGGGVTGYFNLPLTRENATPAYAGAWVISGTTDSATNVQGLIAYPPMNGGQVKAGTMVVGEIAILFPNGVGWQVSGRFTDWSGTHIAESAGAVTGTGTGSWQLVRTLPWTHGADFIPGVQARTTTAATGRFLAFDAVSVKTIADPSAAVNPRAGLASGAGTAPTPRADVKANAGLASGVGAANNPTGSSGNSASPVAGVASGTGTAQTPTVKIAANTQVATAVGTAYNPGVSISTKANAGVATGTGAALAPSKAVTINSQVASSTGTAYAPRPSIAARPSTALGIGEAFTPIILTFLPEAPPDERIFEVEFEDRVFIVDLERRVVRVPRDLTKRSTIEPDPRRIVPRKQPGVTV